MKTNLEYNMEEILNLPTNSKPIVELPKTISVENDAAAVRADVEIVQAVAKVYC